MNKNEALIHAFYSAFANKDYKTMQDSYAPQATFSDPVFKRLNANEVKVMWEMFCKKGRFISLEFKNIRADESSGSAEWIATYIVSATGRQVRNHIYASFIFEQNLISKHTDKFDRYVWAKQAFGWKGALLGWTPFFMKKVSQVALENLNNFIQQKEK